MSYCDPQGKILWHIDRLHEFDKTGTTRPLLFEIDPSNKCNQDCPWCSFSRLRSQSKAMMCKDRLFDLIDELKNLGVKAINWTGGGEPLMNPALLEAVELANVLGIDQGIFTNGLLMNDKVGKILARNLTWIRVSLDGYDEASYAKSHGTNEKCFNTVLENVRRVAKIKDRCTIGVGFIITPDNYMGIEKVVKISKDLGVDYVQLKPVAYRPWEKQIDTKLIRDKFYPMSLDAQKHSTDTFEVIVTHYRFKDMMEDNRGRNYKKCLSHHFQGAIGADEKVYLCDHHKGEKDYILGDLKTQTMEEIWVSNRRKDVIEFLDSTDLSQCQDCCRNHELNKTLWHITNKKEHFHPNHI